MMPASLVGLPDKEKLRILQRLDQFREWHSLNDKRYCLVCGEMITGRDILVIEDLLGSEPTRVVCPTKDCKAVPMEWVQPTDDVLVKIAMVELECCHFRLMARAGRALRSLSQKGAPKRMGGKDL